MKKEKEMCGSFAVAPQAAKVTATVHDKGLVTVEKAWSLWVEGMKRKLVLIDGNVLHQKTFILY